MHRDTKLAVGTLGGSVVAAVVPFVIQYALRELGVTNLPLWAVILAAVTLVVMTFVSVRLIRNADRESPPPSDPRAPAVFEVEKHLGRGTFENTQGDSILRAGSVGKLRIRGHRPADERSTQEPQDPEDP